MKRLSLHDGTQLPVLGLGTWRMGEDRALRQREVTALRYAIDLGYRLFDTAEMYGDGGAEEVLGQALTEAQRSGSAREDFLIVSKFYPHHAEPASMSQACERSRRRLGIDTIDLYLLHWRGGTPLSVTLEGLVDLQARGWIRHWGVSNFDIDDMVELTALPGGDACACNQVYYSLGRRGVEFDLLPWQRQRGMPLMAYCPVDQGRLTKVAPLSALASARGLQAVELALAWMLSRPGVVSIPKAVHHVHLEQNRRAAEIELDQATCRELDRLFAPPTRKHALAMA